MTGRIIISNSRRRLVPFLAVLTALSGAFAGSGSDETGAALLRNRFERRITEIADSVDGVVGYVIKDLVTGDTWTRNADLLFTQASVIKIPVLVELYRRAEAGDIALDGEQVVDGEETVAGSGILQYLTPDRVRMTLRDLAVLMVAVSDNTATNMLIRRLGMDRINRTLDDLGMKRTRLQRIMMDTDAWKADRENLSTPAETARLLEMLYGEQILTPPACRDILDILSIPKPGQIRAGVPPGVRVAHKTGEVGGVINDAGIVYLEGRPFLCVCMVNWMADAGQAEAAISGIAGTAYDYLSRIARSNRYGHRSED